MPIEFMSETTTGANSGGTLFEQMQRTHHLTAADGGALVTVDIASASASEVVRFDRADVDGKPGVAMQERGEDGRWQESWSWSAQSMDAREGMIGWLNTQSHRWGKFARMLHRRGPDELTAWIFELMVVPSTVDARPPRFEPQQWTTIDQYDRPAFLNATGSAAVRHPPAHPANARRLHLPSRQRPAQSRLLIVGIRCSTTRTGSSPTSRPSCGGARSSIATSRTDPTW